MKRINIFKEMDFFVNKKWQVEFFKHRAKILRHPALLKSQKITTLF